MADVFKEFGKAFIPEVMFGHPVRANLRSYLNTAGFNVVPYHFFGILFFLTAFFTYLLFIPFVYPVLAGLNPFAVFILAFSLWAIIQVTIISVIILVITFFLNIKIYKRTRIIEDKMPDFLVLVATNLKGGLSLEQALWAGIRPEFLLLAEEMTVVSKRVMTGNDLDEALTSFVNKYPSPSIKRNLNLIIGEIKSGGKIVQVIDKVIETMKKSKALKAEMAAATVSYMIFIGAVVVVISPALFALAYQLLHIIIGFTQNLGSSLSSGAAGGSMPIDFNIQIDPNNFKKFSVMALATIGVGASMIISIIEKGDIRGGLKYIPAFTIISIVLYFIFMVGLSSVFGNMI